MAAGRVAQEAMGTMRQNREHQEQVSLFQWAEYESNSNKPELRFLFAIPNGGDRHPVVAAKMKAEGVKRGVPDICLPVPRGKYHGLFCENKWGKNKPSKEQSWWLENLSLMGYYTCVAYGFEEMKQHIEAYLRDGGG